MRHYRSGAFAFTLLASTALGTPVLAQSTQPAYRQLDANGVDLTRGDFVLSFVEGSIGSGDAALPLTRRGVGSQSSQWDRIGFHRMVSGATETVTVGLDTTSETFTNGTSNLAIGSTLSGYGDSYTYRTADGTTIAFGDPSGHPWGGATNFCTSGAQASCVLLPVGITSPDGKHVTLGWNLIEYCEGSTFPDEGGLDCTYWWRLSSVANSFGYRIDFSYQSDAPFAPPTSGWLTRTGAGFVNTAVSQSPQFGVGYSHPSATVTQVTDPAGRVWRFASDSGGRTTAIRRPGAASDTTTINYGAGGLVSSVTNEGVTTNYSRGVSGSTATMTVTNALSQVTTVVSDLTKGRPTSITDPLSRTTSFQYDGNARLTRVTRPEGNYTQFTYDSRGNVTETRMVAKSGSGLADIVATASFDSTCANPVKCNKPNSTTDARGNTTDYTYNSTHGGVLTVTAPPPTTGAVRPQTRYSYTLSNGEYRLTQISQCQTQASCTGTADEVKTTLVHNASGQVTGTTIANGTGTLSATVTSTYDAVGNLSTVDGPLAGTADTTKYRYNAARELIGTIGPDPDAGGALKHRAVRNSYTNALLTKVERGTVNSQSDSDWANFAALETVDIAYDSNARVTNRKLSGSGTTYALTQFSYDALGRPDCSAVRMNTAIYGSLPSSACTLGTQGSHGPDRIGKTIYNAAGEVIENRVAVGTSDAATERTLIYTSNGMLATLKDAENNLTTYEYDGFDRLAKTRFPVATKGANQSSTTDYEQLGYDAASNVTSFRNRAGQTIAFGYDALDRQTSKDLPGTEPDVSYAYDLLNRLTSAQQTGNSLSFTYDALGRNLTQVGPQGTVTSEWDLAGRRTKLTYPGTGLYVNYDHLVTGEVTKIRENGATSGVGVLATYAYDNLGRRTSLTFGNGVAQAFTFDPVSRLASLTNNLSGTTNDLSATFAYNPASQIASTTRTGDTYAWTGHFNQNVSSTVNGLNQIASYGAKTVSHDSKGNITAFGTKSFTYSSENLLLTGPSTTLAYDPVMRLRQTLSGGTTLRFAYDGLDRIAEYNGSDILQRRYVHGPGIDEPIVWYEGTGTSNRRFLSADERGSIVSVTDSSGALLGINRYDEYGQPQATNLGVWGYTGQAWLPTLGVWYYKARMYESEAGRFLQTDPIGYADSPNLYAYVLNDPVNFTDPLGLDGDEIVVTALRIALFGTGGDVFAGGGRGGPSYSAYVEQVLEQQQELAEIECAADPSCSEGQVITVTGTKLAESTLSKIFGRGPFKILDFFWHSPAKGPAPATIEDFLRDPEKLKGLSPNDLQYLATDRWRIDTSRQGTHKGQGWALREWGGRDWTGPQIRWHPGSTRPGHPQGPYWRVNAGQGQSDWIPAGPW